MLDETQAIADAVNVIFGALGNRGSEEFERLCLENHLLWRCECGLNCEISEDTCPECEHERS